MSTRLASGRAPNAPLNTYTEERRRGREGTREAAHAIPLHRPADGIAAPETQSGEGATCAGAAGGRQQKLPQ